MNKIKAILMDLDGVLCEAVTIHFDAFNMALREVSNTEIFKHEEIEFNGLTTKKKLEKLTLLGRVNSGDHELIWAKKQDYTKDAIFKNVFPSQQKIELHEYIKSIGAKSACVTNSITETAQLMLERSGQWPYLEFLISNQMVSYPKPHGEGYIIAMVKLGACPNQCVIVEDSPVGIQAAKSTGAHVLEVAGTHEVTKQRLEEFLNKKEV